jgi:hypothetical protein
MWKGLILSCLMSTPAPECSPKTAIDIFKPPSKSYTSLQACQFESLAFAATVIPKNTYPKVYCGEQSNTLGGAAG